MQPHFRAPAVSSKSSKTKKIVFPLALGAFVLVAVHAGAQQASPPTAPPPSAGDSAKPGASDGPRSDNRGENRDRPRFSEEDRMAFFNARLASIRAGLMLTPDQDKMWPQVETAVRDLIKLRAERRARRDAQDQPTGPLERLRAYGDAEAKRGEAIRKFAEAAQPLYASLNDDQKRRLRFLGRGMASMGMMGGMEQRGERWGDRGDGWRGGERRWRDNDSGQGRMRDRRDDDDRYQRRGSDDDRGGGRRFYRDDRGPSDRGGDRGEERRRWREGMRDGGSGFDRGNGIEDWRDRF